MAADRRRSVVSLPHLHHSAASDVMEEWIGALARVEQVRLTVETREVSTGCWLSLRLSWICTRLGGGTNMATPERNHVGLRALKQRRSAALIDCDVMGFLVTPQRGR